MLASTSKAPGTNTGVTTIPCVDCIDGVSPYNPSTWGYVSTIPYNTVSNSITGATSYTGYDVGTNTPAAEVCGSSGDMNLGIIPALCRDPPKAPPISVVGKPYVLVREDCSDIKAKGCIGPALGIEECVINTGSGQKISYGECGAGNEHQWYARDWVTEMNMPGPSGYETMTNYCCFLPPGNLPNGQPRSALCPPNLWYGSSQCQSPAINECSNDPSSSWDAGCDNYIQQNLQTATGKPQFAQGLFLTTLSTWASQFSPNVTPSPTDPFVSTILKWAPSFPGMLAPSLTTACSGVTRDQIGNDTTGNLGKLCACYLPAEQYYLPGVIPKECDSLCSLAGTTGGIPLYQWGNTGIPTIKVCQQTTCVIDNVTLQYANTVSGNMNWSQVCGHCSSGTGCTCVINGINVDSVDSNIPGININQECGSFATANGGIAPPIPAAVESFWTRYKFLLLGGLALGLGLLAFLLIQKIK